MTTNHEAAFAERPEVYAAWGQLNSAIKAGMDLRRYELVTLAAARAAASRRSAYTSFVADPRTGHLRVVSGGEVLLERDLQRSRGVRLEASRESVTFAPGGLGWGAANTTVIVSRGARSDTVVMSRLGRVRTAW